MSELQAPKPWIEHLSNENGVFKKISGRFEFITKAGDFRYGDFVFILENGAILDGRSMLNWYDSFLALARLEPEDVHGFLAEINSSHQRLQQSVQDAHGVYMEEKYPGWRAPGGRKKNPPEEVKSETVNVEDLGL